MWFISSAGLSKGKWCPFLFCPNDRGCRTSFSSRGLTEATRVMPILYLAQEDEYSESQLCVECNLSAQIEDTASTYQICFDLPTLYRSICDHQGGKLMRNKATSFMVRIRGQAWTLKRLRKKKYFRTFTLEMFV